MEYKEWVYIATDLDSGDELKDLAMLPSNLEHDQAWEVIQRKFNTNPIISITGNTWELEDIEPTGKLIDYNPSTKEIMVLRPRDVEYEAQYPMMS